MRKYSDIEIQTAKNLLENGYMWIVRYETGRLIGLSEKPIKRDNLWESFGNTVFVCRYVPIFQSIRSDDKEPVSLESIVHQQILDDVEKKYLSAVIKPFRDRVKHICRINCLGVTSSGYQYIYITLSDDSYNIDLPLFKKDTMYQGMEPGHSYTLKELGL
jgi:hypothetical protein